MNEYIEVILRSVSAFTALLCLALIMGRKQLSQITFFDYVVGITIGSIAAVIVIDRSINVIDGAIALLLWSVMPVVVGFLAMKSTRFRVLVDGEPKIVIQHGVILNKNMLKEKYNMGDLLMQLRDKGVFDISEIDFAVLEANGDLSILKKPQFRGVTHGDIGYASDENGIMTELITDGKIIDEHLSFLGKDREWLRNQLLDRGFGGEESVVFAALSADGRLYVSQKSDATGIHLI